MLKEKQAEQEVKPQTETMFRSLNSPRTSSCLIGGTARSSFGSITEQTNTKVASLLQVLVSVPLQRQKLRDD